MPHLGTPSLWSLHLHSLLLPEPHPRDTTAANQEEASSNHRVLIASRQLRCFPRRKCGKGTGGLADVNSREEPSLLRFSIFRRRISGAHSPQRRPPPIRTSLTRRACQSERRDPHSVVAAQAPCPVSAPLGEGGSARANGPWSPLLPLLYLHAVPLRGKTLRPLRNGR